MLPQLSPNIRRSAFAVGAVALVWLMAIVFVPLFLDHDAIRKQAEKELSAAFGYQTTIRSSSVSFLFAPKIMFEGVVVRNDPAAISDKTLAVNQAELRFSLLALLSGSLIAESLDLNGVFVEVEELKHGEYNIRPPQNMLSAFSPRFAVHSIHVSDGRVHFTPFQSGGGYDMKSLEGSFTRTNSNHFQGDTTFFLDKDRLALHFQGTPLAADAGYTVKTSIHKGDESIAYEGELDLSGQESSAKGNIIFNIQDVMAWMDIYDVKSKEAQLYGILAGRSLQGNMAIQKKGVYLSFITETVKLDDQPVRLEGQFSFKDVTKMRLSSVIDKLSFLSKKDFSYTPEQLNALLQKFLPPDVEGEVDVTVAEFAYKNILAKEVALKGSLLGGEFVINQATAKMDGDSELLLFGIVKPDANQNITLDGNIEILGKDVQAFFTAMDLDKHKLLSAHEGSYRAKANLYLSAKLSNISEIRFQAGDFLVEGGVQYEAEGSVNVRSALRVRGGSLDSLAQYVNPARKGVLSEEDYDTPKITLPWLKELKNSYEIALVFEDYTLFDLNGKRSRVLLSIEPDKIAFRAIDINLGDTRFTGNILIDQAEQLPFINADIYLSEFTIDSLFGHSFRKYPVPRDNVLSIWEDKPLNVDFLKGYDGYLNLKFGNIRHTSATLHDVEVHASINDGLWEIKDIHGKIWGGTVEMHGSLDVSSIAAAKLELQLKNIFVHEMLDSTVDIRAIRGRMNINAKLDTAGISMNNIIDNMSASIVLIGADIIVKGFNMAGLVQALPSVRSTSEVANTTRVSLMGGQTSFSQVEGAFYVMEGQLKTNGLTLRSKHAIGNLGGTANLLTWAMDYSMKLRLPTLAVMDVPVLTMYFRKSMDDPLIQVDTRSLESFMTQRKLNKTSQ
jgi:uncharacterized protein involved in outer membrane biogenesis